MSAVLSSEQGRKPGSIEAEKVLYSQQLSENFSEPDSGIEI